MASLDELIYNLVVSLVLEAVLHPLTPLFFNFTRGRSFGFNDLLMMITCPNASAFAYRLTKMMAYMRWDIIPVLDFASFWWQTMSSGLKFSIHPSRAYSFCLASQVTPDLTPHEERFIQKWWFLVHIKVIWSQEPTIWQFVTHIKCNSYHHGSSSTWQFIITVPLDHHQRCLINLRADDIEVTAGYAKQENDEMIICIPSRIFPWGWQIAIQNNDLLLG